MTLDDLAEKMDKGFTALGDKLDMLNMTVAKHTVSLNGHDREIAELKAEDKELEGKIVQHEKAADTRIAKIERWMWFTLGAGGAAGAGLAKLFMSVLLVVCCCTATAIADETTNNAIRSKIVLPHKPLTRAERTEQMRKALKVDDATRLARQYERQRRKLNDAADAFYQLGSPSNAVTKAEVDFTTGDIKVQWADGSCVLRRFDARSTSGYGYKHERSK